MPDPSSPLGALLYALLAAAILAGLKWAYGKIQTLNLATPLGMISAVMIGTASAVVVIGLIVWLWLHVHVA
ncbi:hypothetical protein [Streptomyces sp. A30]|uniref:hypothetical protein n=1 Tax=Streptomyces sp. A30 TaxID=2789273 RepID=UPI003980F364